MSIKVVVFDDNKNIRNSIIMLLGTEPLFDVVGAFSDAQNSVENVRRLKPDVVLMDIEMPGINGIDAVRQLKKELPDIQILIQTVFEDNDKIYESIIAGASGYVLKTNLKDRLAESIKEVSLGGAPMSPTIARKLFDFLQQPDQFKRKPAVEYNLTSREKEVLTYLVNGLSYKMIGAELGISYETVRSHMKNIYEKLHVASLTEVVAKAINQNIV
jgi:DNA-binding NarL/FixJ family response regulator